MADTQPDLRLESLRRWLDDRISRHSLKPESLRPASDDASFRRYFRVDCDGPSRRSVIVMDAPPEQERCESFLHAANVMRSAGVTVPEVLDEDLREGFLLLEDFGDRTYLGELSDATVDSLYRAASRSLVKLQRASKPGVFADYDETLLLRELRLYPQWYVAVHKNHVLGEADTAALEAGFRQLVGACLAQGRVFVHRDWHSRNLMYLAKDGEPGVLDFQDAVMGPITYDLVSILRDAYIDWPEERQIDWTIRHWEAARAAGLPVAADFSDFYRDFEWMGLQRQLKVLGIFARLHHRDGKSRYLADCPRVLQYALSTARRYRALAGLTRVLEAVENASARAAYSF